MNAIVSQTTDMVEGAEGSAGAAHSPAADVALADWRSMTTDLRAAALDHVSSLGHLNDSAGSRFTAAAVRHDQTGPWFVEAEAPVSLSTAEAADYGSSLRRAAATAAALNAEDRFSIRPHGIRRVSRDEAEMIGTVAPLIATYYAGMLDLRITLGRVWADKFVGKEPGTRWTYRDEDFDDNDEAMHFLYVGHFLVDSVAVDDDGNARLVLQSAPRTARA